jgi:hypothetical protein
MDKKKREILGITRRQYVKGILIRWYYKIKEKIFFWRKYGSFEHWCWVYAKGKTALYIDGVQQSEPFSCTFEYHKRSRIKGEK